MIQKIRQYFREVWLEIGKVTWPTRDELKESTMVVIVGTFIMTLFILIADKVVDAGVKGLIHLLG
ncbi:MAG: preprotein translocase subunit SecE [bacterium]|nr:preprotein translocase subunit SecE [bacterium]